MLLPRDHTFAICAHEENPLLSDAVESIMNQSMLGNVIITTSTPNDFISGVASKHDLPVFVNEGPKGMVQDWNFGYNEATTSLVTVVHQDDIYEPEYLDCVLRAANSYSPDEISIVFTDYFEIRNGDRVESNALLKIKRIMNAPLIRKTLNSSSFVKRRIMAFGNPICCPSVTFAKRNLGESVFDTRYEVSCDYKTFVNLASERGRFVYVPKMLMGHRISEETATSQGISESRRKADDAEILGTLWPKPIAKIVNAIYSLSEKSNQLN